MRPLAQRVLDAPSSATVRIVDLAAALRRKGVDVIDLSAGRASEHTPEEVCEVAAQALSQGDTHQTPAQGKPEFRAACARKLARENGIAADPEKNIIATLGCKQGLTLALMATIDAGGEVIVEDPCFVSYQPTNGLDLLGNGMLLQLLILAWWQG
jgi:aspartate/methionine/tyrosine aminotransferase